MSEGNFSGKGQETEGTPTTVVLTQTRAVMGWTLDWGPSGKDLNSKKFKGQHGGTEGKNSEATQPMVLEVPQEEVSQDESLLTSPVSRGPDNLMWFYKKVTGMGKSPETMPRGKKLEDLRT